MQVEISLGHREKQDGDVVTSLIRDITECKRAEEQLKQANAKLVRREKEILDVIWDLKKSHQELKATQLQLIQAEKKAKVIRRDSTEAFHDLATAREVNSYLSVARFDR